MSEIGICIIRKVMTASAALHKQIERYRIMTGEERLAIALDLHDVSCDIAREGIRHDHPEADPAEVERLLRRRRWAGELHLSDDLKRLLTEQIRPKGT